MWSMGWWQSGCGGWCGGCWSNYSLHSNRFQYSKETRRNRLSDGSGAVLGGVRGRAEG